MKLSSQNVSVHVFFSTESMFLVLLGNHEFLILMDNQGFLILLANHVFFATFIYREVAHTDFWDGLEAMNTVGF